MTGSTAFVDTNILVYAFTNDRRSVRASTLLAERPQLSVQSLNEFASVARRKLGFTWDELAEALADIAVFCPDPVPLGYAVHSNGLRLAERYGFAIYDSMIVAAALAAGCDTLWSEDMQNGLVVVGSLTIRNPFTDQHP